MERKTYEIPEIEDHLRSAVDVLIPDVIDRINLDQLPQEERKAPSFEAKDDSGKILKLYRRARTAAAAMAACLCLVAVGGGVNYYQNHVVDSLIGIDVNPSIELSVNKKDRVMKAEALNQDAVAIIDGMNLTNVDLDIAVNALVGSMVRNGYLDEIDNAILVTVSNDSKEKADTLRYNVVSDFRTSLEEHNVQAVVYDQQSPESKEMKALADQLGISIGKAYFLSELVKENNLSESDMVRFADMSMGEIASEIAKQSYKVKNDRTNSEEGISTVVKAPETVEQTTEEETTAAETEAVTEAPESPEETSGQAAVESSRASDEEITVSEGSQTAVDETEAAEEVKTTSSIRVDYTDYYEGILTVYFKTKVKWKNPTVSVHDSEGSAYAATIEGTGSDFCEIAVTGIPGGDQATFDIAGVASREDEIFASVRGYFHMPDIADDIEEGDNRYGAAEDDETNEEQTASTPESSVSTDPAKDNEAAKPDNTEAEIKETAAEQESRAEENSAAEETEAESQ